MASGLREIAVAVVVHDGRVLVGRRAGDAAEHPGCAEFPGGKIEPHETSDEAAIRECLEETGVAIRVLDRTLQDASSAASPPRSITFHWAAPIDPTEPPRPPFAWVPITELARLTFPPANARVIAILVEHARPTLTAGRSLPDARDGTGRSGRIP